MSRMVKTTPSSNMLFTENKEVGPLPKTMQRKLLKMHLQPRNKTKNRKTERRKHRAKIPLLTRLISWN